MTAARSEFDISRPSGFAAGGVLCGLLAGLLTAVAFLMLNPDFLVDSAVRFLIYFMLLPMAAGLASGLLPALAMDTDIFDHLLLHHRPEAVFYYQQTIDPISHNYWEYYEPQRYGTAPEEIQRYGGVVEETYRAVDRALGRLLCRLDPRTPLMIISDHGFQSIPDQPGFAGSLISIKADVLLETMGLDGLEGFHTMNNAFIAAQTADPEQADRLLGEAVERISEYWIPEVDKPLFVAQLMDNPGTDATTCGSCSTKT